MAASNEPQFSPPFFTDVDPEIAVKGSIDPIGMTALWSRHGRQIVGNLTLVASRARGYTTLLLGFYFARQVLDRRQLEDERFIEAFLIFEQMAGYSRYAYREETNDRPNSVLGVRRVMARYHASKGRPTFGAHRDAQILSNQKSYGLTGLFSVAAEASKLVDRKGLRLTPEAQRHLETQLLPRFGRYDDRDAQKTLRILERAMQGKQRDFRPEEERDASAARAIAWMHKPEFDAVEQEFYLSHLVRCRTESSEGRQASMWEVVAAVNDAHNRWADAFDMDEMELCVAEADARGADDLYRRLVQIREFERVAAPAFYLFSFLQTADGRGLEEVARDVRTTWGSRLAHISRELSSDALRPVVEIHGEEGEARFQRLAHALATGDYLAALEAVIDQNRAVTKERGGNAWIEVDGGKVEVKYRQEPAKLPPAEDLPRLWVYPYFLTALKSVGAQVTNHYETPEAAEAP